MSCARFAKTYRFVRVVIRSFATISGSTFGASLKKNMRRSLSRGWAGKSLLLETDRSGRERDDESNQLPSGCVVKAFQTHIFTSSSLYSVVRSTVCENDLLPQLLEKVRGADIISET